MYVFSVCKDRFHLTRVSPRYDGSDDRVHSARGHPNRRITKITRNVNATLFTTVWSDTTVWLTAHTVRTVNRTVVSCFLTRASMGKSNYYDKMKWQDSIKVIITQKLHQIRNWEFHNMLNGMSTIEMIENLKIENLTKIGWYDGSDDRRRIIQTWWLKY